MQEAFLQYVWRTRRFDIRNLHTTRGEQIRIIDFGQFNTDSGPDFKHARIRIADTIWAGHVEIHVKSSDWLQHRHDDDPAYENVILHVVLEDDLLIADPGGNPLPCLVLKAHIDPDVLKKYERLQYHEPFIPCQRHLDAVPEITVAAWTDRMLAERMAAKASTLEKVLDHTKGHWEETFYICMARSFGLFQNQDALGALAKRLPLNTIRKHRGHPLQVEALLFGTSGLLPASHEHPYVRDLIRESAFLRQKYAIGSMNPAVWQFFRMRPVNFPTIRIAQFASFLDKQEHLLYPFLEYSSLAEIRLLFRDITPAHFWTTHYHFHKESAEKEKTIGDTFIHLLVINTIAPFLYLYGQKRNQKKWIDRAISWMGEIPAESNRTIRKWREAGIRANNAGQSQGLLHLKKHYCDERQCLKCGIGHQVLSYKE